MNLLGKLFSRTPSATDIRLRLKEIEREQRKKRRDLEVMEQTKQQKVQEAVAAKKAGKQEVLRDIFREMRQGEIDWGHVNNDLRRLSLGKTALTSFLRKMEILEKKRDRKSLQNLIGRFRESSIQKTIDSAEVDDDTFNDMLEEILGEEELSATQGKVKEDVGFAEFDRAIGEMAKVEEAGATERSRAMATSKVGSRPRQRVKILSDDDSEEDKELEKEVEQGIHEMEQELERLTKEIEEMRRQVAELRAQAAQLDAQAASKDEEVKAKQEELSRLIAEGEVDIALSTVLQQFISDGLELIKSLKSQEDEDTNKADELEGLIAGKEQEVSAKQAQIAALRAQLA